MTTLFEYDPIHSDREITELLLECNGARIERIVSYGKPSPQGFWYDQTESEWVSLLASSATLLFKDHVLDMKKGDHVFIPSNTLHRVEKVSDDAIWLAVYLK